MMTFKRLTPAIVSAGLIMGISQPAFSALANGGFETGDLTGWTATTNGSTNNCDTDWNVSASGNATGCTAALDPLEGSYAAYNSLDGDGPQQFILEQDFQVASQGLNSAVLEWSDTAVWNIHWTTSVNRIFSVDLFDSADILVGNVFSLDFIAGTTGSHPWTTRSFDILSLLSGHEGETVTLAFTMNIPEAFTGPAGFGLDAVSLEANPVPVPAAAWLFGTSLIGLFGFGKRRKIA